MKLGHRGNLSLAENVNSSMDLECEDPNFKHVCATVLTCNGKQISDSLRFRYRNFRSACNLQTWPQAALRYLTGDGFNTPRLDSLSKVTKIVHLVKYVVQATFELRTTLLRGEDNIHLHCIYQLEELKNKK
jgi:hypothetical protein